MDLIRWERAYKKAAKADHYDAFRKHLSKLELPDTPELLLEGTLNVVQACAAYCNLDGQSLADFLAMQTYDPADSPDAPYSFTLNICGKAYARILISTLKKPGLDLADLFEHPWNDYRVCGYHCFWVSRNDHRKLSRKELARITKEVTYDLRFDYCEDDLSIDFDDESIAGVLRVDVQEPWFPEGEE